MAKAKAQREAEERLRKNNERIYKETGYDPDGWAERIAGRTYYKAIRPQNTPKRNTYAGNAARNARDIAGGKDPYAWQNREGKTTDFKPIWSLPGLFDALDQIKKDKEKSLDASDPTKTGIYADWKGDEMKSLEEKHDAAAAEKEAAREAAQEEMNRLVEESMTRGIGAQGTPEDPNARNLVMLTEAERSGITVKNIAARAAEAAKQAAAQEKVESARRKTAAAAEANDARKQYANALDALIYADDAAQDKDFETYAKQGEAAANELIENIKGKGVQLGAALSNDDKTFALMTINDSELKIYAALAGKYGKEIAERYLDAITPELEARAAGKIYDDVENIDNEALKKIARWGVTAGASGQEVRRNLLNLPGAVTGSEDVTGPGTLQKARERIGENLEGVEKVVNDVTGSVINMLPAVGLSFVPGAGPALSAGYTGATSYSNAYSDAILSGYAPGEAAAYALPSAASEALLGYVTGGVAKMGGSKSLANMAKNALAKAMSNPAVEKALGRAAEAGSEALEEYLQANLDPILRNAVLGEDNEINPISEDKLYAALLGALTSAGMNTATDAAEIADAVKTGKAYNSPDVMRALVEQGLASRSDTSAYGQAQRLAGKLEAGKNVSNFEAGSLAQANEAAIAAEARANAILDKTGVQRAYDPNETVKLADGREVVIVARDGSEYTAIVPGESGYTRITIDEILHRESARRAVDAYLHPEDKADITGKYDHRRVEKTADQTFLDNLQKRYGIKAVIEDLPAGAEAFYDRSTNTIHFAPDSTRADVIGGVAAHELSHAAEDSKHYKAYSDYVLNKLYGGNETALAQAVEAKQEQYIRRGIDLSDAEAVAEIVADYTRSLYKSEADIEALVTGNRGMAQGIYDSIKTTIRKIRAFFKGDEAALANIREYQDLRRAQKLFEKALSTRLEVQADMEAAPAYAIDNQNGGSVTQKLQNNIAQMENMSPVAELTGREFEKGDTSLIDQVSDYFDEIGNVVTNPEIGDVILNRRGVKDSMAHGIGRTKAIAFKAVPAVIENGKIIDAQQNWKGRGADTFIVAAPITINGEEHYLGAVVSKTGENNRFYLHEVIEVDTKKDASASFKTGGQNNLSLPGDASSSLSTDIIPQTDGDVNRQYSVQGENSLEELTRKYGEIESGEKPVRDAKLPRQTREDRFLSKYARTLYEANATNDSVIPALESKIEEGEFSHERISNKRTVDRIQKIADTKGIDSLQKQWDGLVSDTDARIAKADDIAVGQFLYNEYVKVGDYDSAIRMAVELSTEATRAGQTVQAFRILKKLSPDGQLYAMEQMADKINRELAKKLRDKAPTIEIDSRLERNLLQAKTKEEINSAVDAIKQNIADQMPATWVDKLNAWRYLSMLGNPRTHIRNIVGNAIFVPVRQFKNLLGAGLEHVANVDQTQRTKSLLHPKKDKSYIEAGQKSFHDVQDILKGNEKYGTGDLNERRTIFKTKLLEAARKLNFKLLEFGDMVFMRSAYVRSYAQAMKARGLNAETMTATQERSVSEYAMNEALKATYRDYNALAAALNKFKRSGKVQTLIGEGLFPFTKTPLNVLKRGVEYSPAGVAKGIYEALHDVRNGAKTASEAIDTISAGLSGTGVMALGAFLAAQGLIVGGNGDDDNEAALDKLTGGQNYAIQIGDKSYTIDWAAPVSMPLFVGVELYNTMQTGNAGASFKNILDSLTKISDPLFNLSMLSSINSAIEAAKYSVGSPLTDIGINIATSYAGQFIPTALGQFARITDDTVRKTYYDKNSGLPKAVDSLLQGALKKIPGASTILQPSVDRWGREIKSGSMAERVLENLISPGYYSERKTTSADEEIDRLYKQIGDSSVIPPLASKYITIDGERIDLSAEKYTEYAKTLGQTAYEMVDSIISNKVYAGLTDREKAEAIKGAYDYARETAKAQISEYKPEKWVEELQGSAVNKGLYFSLKAQTSKISNAYDTTTGEKVENTASLAIKDIIDQTTATDGIKKKLYGLLGVNKTVQSGKVTWDGIDRANLSWGDAEIEPTTPGTQSGTGRSTAATIPEAKGYELPNYKASTLEKISNIGVSPEDYAYIDDRIDAKEDKVAYLQELGFDGKQLSGLVESFVMGKTAKDKMRVAEEDMNIDNGTYIDAYIFGYSSVGSKSERNAQIREYVNGLPLSDEQKDALYNWVKVSRGKTADGKQTGGSSGGSGRHRSGGRSGGKSAGVSQAIPDSVWNEMRSNVKTPTIQYDNPAWGTLKALLDRGDKIREETMQRELAAVDATPYMSSAWRAERKREIRKRYERGMMA